MFKFGKKQQFDKDAFKMHCQNAIQRCTVVLHSLIFEWIENSKYSSQSCRHRKRYRIEVSEWRCWTGKDLCIILALFFLFPGGEFDKYKKRYVRSSISSSLLNQPRYKCGGDYDGERSSAQLGDVHRNRSLLSQQSGHLWA